MVYSEWKLVETFIMRIIITGVNGRVGYDIARRLYQHNTVIGVGRQ